MLDHRDLKLTKSNMDIYYPLTKKVKIISKVAKKYFRGKLLDVGCGVMPYKKLIQDYSKIDAYHGLDIDNPAYQKKIKPDLLWDGTEIPVVDDVYDSAMLIEVLEHVPKPEIVLKEVNRALKKDGILLITIPFLWSLHDIPYDEYRYTPFALRRLVEESGFEVLELEAFGGWHASMATMLALYTRRGLNGRKKKLASFVFKPIIKYLHKKDTHSDHATFREGQMITGLWCVAKAN